jgi:hypothetical protein
MLDSTGLEGELKLQLAIGYRSFLGEFKKADMSELHAIVRRTTLFHTKKSRNSPIFGTVVFFQSLQLFE